MTYRQIVETGKRILETSGIPEAALDARLLLEFVCNMTRHELLMHLADEVEEENEKSYVNFLEKRAAHIPLQHLTGVQEFMGLEFFVNEYVLIPRQDTEILVEEVLRHLHDGMRILDVCTGSGCILLSLLKYSNDCCGIGADISEDALQTARRNAQALSLETTEFINSDLFAEVTGKFDMIVSNPPYIRSSVIPELMAEVREHEPALALDGGEDGLDFYRRIIHEGRQYLYRGAFLFLEIGYDQGEAVKAMMEQNGFTDVEIKKDLAGLDRVVMGVYSNV